MYVYRLTFFYIGSDNHQPTSEEKVGCKPENKGPVTPPLNPVEERLLFSKPVEVAAVETVAGEGVAVAGESGAGGEGVVEDNEVEEGDEPVGGDRGSEAREIPAVSSREQSEETSLSTTSAVTTTSSDQQESKSIVPTSVDPGNQGGSKVKPPLTSTSKGMYNYNQRWRSESRSPLSSDDEWDESLLPPR